MEILFLIVPFVYTFACSIIFLTCLVCPVSDDRERFNAWPIVVGIIILIITIVIIVVLVWILYKKYRLGHSNSDNGDQENQDGTESMHLTAPSPRLFIKHV